jgi:hypothetical protein
MLADRADEVLLFENGAHNTARTRGRSKVSSSPIASFGESRSIANARLLLLGRAKVSLPRLTWPNILTFVSPLSNDMEISRVKIRERYI